MNISLMRLVNTKGMLFKNILEKLKKNKESWDKEISLCENDSYKGNLEEKYIL